MNHPNLTMVFGPPGTGKTTDQIRTVERELNNNVSPHRIGYFAFTKKAAAEAIGRACTKFGLDPQHLPYFRTIHSLAFRQLNLKPDGVMQRRHYRELGDRLGLELGTVPGIDDQFYGMSMGDRIVFLEGLARIKQEPLQSVWEAADEIDIDYRELERYGAALAAYKTSRGLTDYTDMLEAFAARPELAPALDVLIVDEAQDLSKTQWKVVEMVAARAKRVYVAGDDDQAVFRWAGADVETFMNLKGKKRVLGQSYRVPSAVHEVAENIAHRITNRTPKQWLPRKERGSVNWYMDTEELDLSESAGFKEYREQNPHAIEWLLLARNGYMLQGLEDMCRRQGFSYTSVGKSPLDSPALKAIILYERLRAGKSVLKSEAETVLDWTQGPWMPRMRAGLKAHKKDKPVTMADFQNWGFCSKPPIWHAALIKISDDDREFFIAARRRGETLTKTPRIHISTIHTSKGGEADHVALLTDMSQRTYSEMERFPDNEHRVQYVAVTRTRRGLHMIQPQTGNCYEL